MKEYFLKLFQFNAWANDRVMACLKKQSVGDPKILSLSGHYLAAQFLWLHRVKGLPPPNFKLWGKYTLEELDNMSMEANRQWLDFVETNATFNRELTYRNYVGDLFTNNVEGNEEQPYTTHD